jgi:hypothetical protein
MMPLRGVKAEILNGRARLRPNSKTVGWSLALPRFYLEIAPARQRILPRDDCR